MALPATIYTFQVELSDVDRGVYESLSLKMARQPSETEEYLVTRFLAYCLEYTEGVQFTEGVASGDEPAVLIRDLTQKVTAWIEVGKPDPNRLHKGRKLAGRAAVYTHRKIAQVLGALNGAKIFQAAEIPVYEFDPKFIGAVAAALPRRAELALSVTERELYLDVDGQSFSTTVVEHRFE